MPKLNAAEAISPAMHLAKADLFQPFRWGFWVRIGILGLLTGEMSAGGGCNFHIPSNWNTHSNHFGSAPLFGPHFDPRVLLAFLPVIIAVALALGLILMYIGSVCRFILLEAILNGQVSLREGWERWQRQGTRFFVFRLLLALAFFCIVGVVAVVILTTVGVATFTHGGHPSAGAIAAIILAGLTILLFAIPFVLVYLFAKDFAVPVMALEGTTFGEAWSKVWAMIKNETGSVAGYVGMKIILSIAAGIIFGIIIVVAVLALIIPFGGIGVVSVLAGKAAGLTFTPLTISLLVAFGVIFIGLMLFVISVISAPVSVFFPAYGLYFFAGRYQPLHDRLFPPPPQAPPIVQPPPEPLGN